MKNLKKNLQAVNKELKALSKKTENLVKMLEKTTKPKAAKATKAKTASAKPEKSTVSKKADTKTAFDTVVGIINRHRKGVTVNQIKEKTGYDAKKIANIVYKGKINGKIKSVNKGVYLKA